MEIAREKLSGFPKETTKVLSWDPKKVSSKEHWMAENWKEWKSGQLSVVEKGN